MITRQTPAQTSFFFMDTPPSAFDIIEKPDLASYDHILVAFSGGKDSLACVLHLLDEGADPAKIELWHHDIDGREGGPRLMDWPCTPSYCEAVAKTLGLPIFFSWRRGGFLGEMMRQNTPTAAVTFQSPDGEFTTGGKSKDLGTRLRFPQVAADLQTRWCSAYDYRRIVNTADLRFMRWLYVAIWFGIEVLASIRPLFLLVDMRAQHVAPLHQTPRVATLLL